MMIRRASLLWGDVVDIRVSECITEIGVDLDPMGDFVFDAAGGLVIPGLHDHHLHVRAAAAALASVPVGPPQVRDRSQLGLALEQAVPGDDGWIRAVGYHDSVAGPLTRDLLDQLVAVVPLRVQHRSGVMWVLNSVGLAFIGLDDHPDGQLFRVDSAPPWPDRRAALGLLSDTLLSYGVTGVTDATPGQSASDLQSLGAAHLSGEFTPRLHCLARPEIDAMPGVTLGPTKRILDDITLDLESLQDWIAHCHGVDRAVAVHCVTASQLVVTMAALRGAGVHPGDRIEHAAVVPADCIADLAELGVTVVTQPNFVAERGDEYLTDVPVDEHDQLWRVGSLRAAGVQLALSTDAPFGAADPWAAMRAAVQRVTPSGSVLGSAERVTATEALMGFLGAPDDPSAPRTVSIGAPGDLCVLSGPAATVLAELDARLIAATVVGGELKWRRAGP
jgi:predicted amidohydrolase YtcJ